MLVRRLNGCRHWRGCSISGLYRRLSSAAPMSRSSTTVSSKGAGLVISRRADFDTARHVFGSGAKQAGEDWLVVSPSHTMEAIYLLVQPAGHLVSNSLAFLCSWTEIELPFDRGIAARLFSAADGVEDYERELFEGPGWSIRRACFDNLAIGPDGVRYLAKPAVEERFTDFSAYETYLVAALASVVANGTDPLRRVRYELSSTCSSGSIRRPARRLQPSSGRGAPSRSAARGAAARIPAGPSSSGSGSSVSRSIARFDPRGRASPRPSSLPRG